MTATNPLQLHLFDAMPDPETTPPDRQSRLLTLTGMFLSKAAGDRAGMVADAQIPPLGKKTKGE
jgi:hypothetical protein